MVLASIAQLAEHPATLVCKSQVSQKFLAQYYDKIKTVIASRIIYHLGAPFVLEREQPLLGYSYY